MKVYNEYKCITLKEVQNNTKNLDRASLVSVFISDGGVMKKVEHWNGIYNHSRGLFCTVVSKHYNLIQHKEYIDNFAQVLDRLGLKYTMFIKPFKNKVFVDVNFVGKNCKFDKLGEEFVTGIRLMNSYDKTTGLGIMPRLTRLACLNGMILTRDEMMFSVKHTSNILKEMEAFIERRINLIINEHEDLKMWVSVSMKDSIEWNTVCKILEKLINTFKHREEILKLLGITVITKEGKNKKKEINYLLENKKIKKITRWEFYNAMTNYITHGEHITPHIENYYQKQAEKVLITPFEQLVLIK